MTALAPVEPPRRTALAIVAAVCLLAAGGCDSIRSKFIKSTVSVPPLLTPLAEADTTQLVAEVNRAAQVRSLRGKVDIQFLDTSFAKCGIAEKYRTADGSVTLQREGKIYLVIQAPFIGEKIAEMTSDGERFRVAVLQGDEKYRRFAMGTNKAEYGRLDGDGRLTSGQPEADCGDGKKSAAMQQRAVGALSGLRPQHFTDALLVRPAAAGAQPDLIYSRSEAFVEEADDRPNAKGGRRVVRGYYVLDELLPEQDGRARVLRRFWFDRTGAVRFARMQTFGERGQLETDVVYKNPQRFGEEGKYLLPASVEITRPQDRYSLRVSYQSPGAVKVDTEYPAEVFTLQNTWGLKEVDLDKRQ